MADCNKHLKPLHAWCNRVLPAVYDDSLSYYETLCKIFCLINEDREAINANYDAIMELQGLIDKYLAGGLDPDIERAVNQWFEEHGDELEQIIQQYFEDNPEAVDDAIDEWSKKNWNMYTHPGTDSFVLWYSTSTGSIVWDEYFEPFIDHTIENNTGSDDPPNDNEDSKSFVNIYFYPSTNLMILRGRIFWKENNGETIEEHIQNDERFLRKVPPTVTNYNAANFPYPGNATTPAEAMNYMYWFPLFRLKDPIGWGAAAPSIINAYVDTFFQYSPTWKWYKDGEHESIAMWSRLETNNRMSMAIYGDGNFIVKHQLKSLWIGGVQDTGLAFEFNGTLQVPPNGFLSQYQGMDGYEINEKAINWGLNHQGFFYYGAIGNKRLDLIPDKSYNGQMYPQTDCSALIWDMYYYGSNIPIGSAAPGREMMLGEYVTFARGGYWSSSENRYIEGEPLDLSVMRPGDLIGFQTKLYGDMSQLPQVQYNASTGMPLDSTVGIVKDGYYPPHNVGYRGVYTKMNKRFLNVVDLKTKDFYHVAMYIGDNKFIEISGYTKFNTYFPVGHRSYGSKSPLTGIGNNYGNPTHYVNCYGEQKEFAFKLLSNDFDPHLGPYVFEGADIMNKDIIATDVSNPAMNNLMSSDRYVVRLFPDSVFYRCK